MTEEEKAARIGLGGFIGASECAACVGVNPYLSSHKLWLKKKGLIDDDGSIITRHGNFVEEFIAQEYTRETGVECKPSRTYRHPKYSFFGCTPDREIEVTFDGKVLHGILECKSVGHFPSLNFGVSGEDAIVEHYLLQIIYQLAITKKDFVQLAALIDTRELRIYTYTLNPEFSTFAHVFPMESVKDLFNECGKWWQEYMVNDNEPPLSSLDCDMEWVQSARTGYDNGLEISADNDIDDVCVKLKESTAEFKKWEVAKKEQSNIIRQYFVKERACKMSTSVGDFSYKTDVRGIGTLRTPFKTNNV